MRRWIQVDTRISERWTDGGAKGFWKITYEGSLNIGNFVITALGDMIDWYVENVSIYFYLLFTRSDRLNA